MHNMSNLEADGLEQQKTTMGFTLVSQERKSEAVVDKGSPKLDICILEKCSLVSGLLRVCDIHILFVAFF